MPYLPPTVGWYASKRMRLLTLRRMESSTSLFELVSSLGVSASSAIGVAGATRRISSIRLDCWASRDSAMTMS